MRLNIEHKGGQTFISVHDGDRMVARAAGRNAQVAAGWLMVQVERIQSQTRDLLVDAGLDPDVREP